MPLRAEMLNQAPRSGPGVTIFGVLAPGATLETAQAELTTVGRSAAIEQRATHEHLQPRVQSYAKLFFPPPSGEDIGIFFSIYVFAVLLVVLVCSNVALLMFARAATRENELVMRSALGANRIRIVMQMFVEALVLGGVAAVVGLVAADVALRNWGMEFLEVNIGRLPFWFDLRVSPGTVLYALGLTVLGSAIAGVLPALKVTRGMGSRMKQAAAGAGGLQFGGVWTAVIVAQVAVTVAFPAVVYMVQWQLRHTQTFDVGFADEEYLAVQIETDAPIGLGSSPDPNRDAQRAALGATLQELRRRVAARPEVAGVAFVDRLPGDDRPDMFIELSYDQSVAGRPAVVAGTDSPPPSRIVTIAAVEPSYFDALGAPIVAGRAFNAADMAPGVDRRDRRPGLRRPGAAGAQSDRPAGALHGRWQRGDREHQSLVRDCRRGEGSRHRLAEPKVPCGGLLHAGAGGAVQPALHAGARAGRADGAQPAGARDCRGRGSDAAALKFPARGRGPE